MPQPEVHVLLMLDIVDSTALTECLGDQGAAELWAAHDRLARDLFIAWHGREIDKTDGFLVLFADVASAAACALAYHHAMASLSIPLQARGGLHLGSLILRENSSGDVALGAKPVEVEGLAKPTAARVMSLAPPGATLLTAEARGAWHDPALRVLSHGYYQLKGVVDPVELFEIGDALSPFVPPADTSRAYRVVRHEHLWQPAREIDNNLPQPMTSFIGRQRELSALVQRLRLTRLLSLTGTGGLGKTRLSVQMARSVLGAILFRYESPALDCVFDGAMRHGVAR